MRTGRMDLVKIPDEQLPMVISGKTLKAKREYVGQLHPKRTETGERIPKLYLERQQYLATKLGLQQCDKTLDYAVIQAVRGQAQAKGFSSE